METNRKLMMDENFVPVSATSPWEIVVDEYKARGMSQKDLANAMGVQASNLNRCIKQKSPVTLQIAQSLEGALGIPASSWMMLQEQYEKDSKNIALRDKRNEEAQRVENNLDAIVNVKELYKALKIKSYLYVHQKMEKIEKSFGMPATCLVNCCGVGAFKKSDKSHTDERNLNTWVLLAYHAAMNNKPRTAFTAGNAEKAALLIAEAANKGTITEKDIKEILDDKGISYSVVGKLNKTPVDAFSMWAFEYPSITVTHRYNDMGRLVFNVLHELKHIASHLEKGGDMSFISSDDSYCSENKEEMEANKFAEDTLIPPPVWKKIMTGRTSLNKIVSYLTSAAKENGLSKNIVFWRFKHDRSIYNLSGTKPQEIK